MTKEIQDKIAARLGDGYSLESRNSRNAAIFGYNLAQEEIERLKKFIEDTFWERHDINSIPDAEAWQEFKIENNL